MINYTAKYTKIESGYMGQVIEWPEVITEGKDLEDCRTMLRDALNEMVLAYNELGKEIPLGNALIEQLPVEVEHVGQATCFNTLFGKERFLMAREGGKHSI